MDDGTELNLELSLGIGAGTVRPAIRRSSSAAVGGKEALSMVESSNSAPMKNHQMGEMDLNLNPTSIPRADRSLDIGRKVEGLSETNTLPATHAATGMNMAGIIPNDGSPKRGRVAEESYKITEPMPIVVSNGVEGIVYEYTSRRIIIMCLCHGEFHTPAGFVSHTGGGCDGTCPLKCIFISKADDDRLRSTLEGQNTATGN